MDETTPETTICQSDEPIDYGPLDDYIVPNPNDPLHLEEARTQNAVDSITENTMNHQMSTSEQMNETNMVSQQHPMYDTQQEIPRYSPDFISNDAAKEKLKEHEKTLEHYRLVIDEQAKLTKKAEEGARILKESQDVLKKLTREHNSTLLETTMGTQSTTQSKKVIPVITIKQEKTSDNEGEHHLKTGEDGERKKQKGVRCNLCKKPLPNETMLKTHLKKKHNIPANPQAPLKIPPLYTLDRNPPPIIKCQICHANISNQTMLELHMKNLHGLNIPPTNPRENSPKMSTIENKMSENYDYNPPPACNQMIPEHREFYRNHPNESRVEAANRRMYLAKTHTRYKEVVDWIIEEILIDLKQNPDWRITICTRNKNLNNPEKRQSTCQWFQTGRCPDRRPCHAEKKEFKVSYTHACEVCYKLRNGLMEHPSDHCELLALLDEAERGNFPDPDIVWKVGTK
jgi:KaiC/GvpD/RAD55 family RecA-like ATPase